MKYLHLSTYLLFTLVYSLHAQQEVSPDSIMKRLLTQTALFPQENIYTQTDKSDYVVGDTIWFRTYLVNAISRKPENASRYVYAELIDEETDTLICRVKARKDTEEMIHGYMPIPRKLHKGNYRFRTYTRYGCNWKEYGFYNKPLRIYSANSTEAGEHKTRKNDYQVDFLPEGGQAIHSQLCRFAFKAQNNTGNGEYVKGTIVDEKGDTIIPLFTTQHNGMGELSFIPLTEKKYYAICSNSEGKEKTFVLPKAFHNAATLQVTANAQQYNIALLHDSLFKADSLKLLVLQKGHPYCIKYWGKKRYMIFPKQSFNTGVTHFILLTADNRIISERLAFINHPEEDNTFSLSSDCAEFIPRHLVQMELALKPLSDSIVEGNCSVAVTDATDVPIDRTTNILSTLLLTADISGQVEKPGWYFEKPFSKEKEKAIDLLMMTHGWKRYDLQAAINGKYIHPVIKPEMNMEISGTVNTLSGKPANEADIQVYAQEAKWIESLKTNKNGQFRLSGFELPDSTKYLITAISEKKKKNLVIQVDTVSYPMITPHIAITGNNVSISDFIKFDEEAYVQKAIRNLGYDHGMKHYLLEEVKVSAKPKKVYRTEYEHDANITITEQRIKQSAGLLNLDMILRSVAGFFKRPTPRGNVRLILDEVPVYDSIYIEQLLHSFDPINIGQIDIIKGANAIGYFDAKQNTIIAITTKRGGKEYNYKYADTNMTIFTPLSYQQPVEMYVPQYDHPFDNSDKPDLRTTIYWKPNLIIKNGKAHFSFYTADPSATYNIVIEGVLSDGKVFRTEGKLF